MWDEARAELIGALRDKEYENGKLNETIQKLTDEKENLQLELKLYKDSLDPMSWD